MPTDLPPGYTPPGQQPEQPTNWTGLIGLLVLCATVVAIVWLVTQ